MGSFTYTYLFLVVLSWLILGPVHPVNMAYTVFIMLPATTLSYFNPCTVYCKSQLQMESFKSTSQFVRVHFRAYLYLVLAQLRLTSLHTHDLWAHSHLRQPRLKAIGIGLLFRGGLTGDEEAICHRLLMIKMQCCDTTF